MSPDGQEACRIHGGSRGNGVAGQQASHVVALLVPSSVFSMTARTGLLSHLTRSVKKCLFERGTFYTKQKVTSGV